MRLLWYAGYGSNLYPDRLRCYLSGGVPAGSTRRYPGARDPSPPRDERALVLRGSVAFAGASSVWGGGMAFYDPKSPGPAPARAVLVTAAQLTDVVAQERHLEPGSVDDVELLRLVDALGEAAPAGRPAVDGVVVGPGRYGTLVRVATIDGVPVLTLTGDGDLPPAAPSPAYLRTIAGGLAATHGWSSARCAAYLASRPGAAGTWTADSLEAALASPP